MTHAEIPLLFEKGPLRIRYLKGEGTDLVVSFSGVGTQRHSEPPPEFPGIASAQGQNHVLFVSDLSRSWLNGEGLASQILCCLNATASHIGAQRAVAIGNSMGGTMALHLSRLFEFDRVIAFTPQYSVLPGEVPEEDRWFFFRKQIKSFPFPRVEQLSPKTTRYFIFHGDEHRELAHAVRFPHAPGILHYIIPGTDHRVAAHLRDRGHLRPLMESLLNGQTRRFRRQLESLGAIPILDYDQGPSRQMDQRLVAVG